MKDDHYYGILYDRLYLLVRCATVQKMMTDKIEAFFLLANPLTPCPNVHPPASPLPTPTRNPAIASTTSSVFFINELESNG